MGSECTGLEEGSMLKLRGERDVQPPEPTGLLVPHREQGLFRQSYKPGAQALWDSWTPLGHPSHAPGVQC